MVNTNMVIHTTQEPNMLEIITQFDCNEQRSILMNTMNNLRHQKQNSINKKTYI